MAAAITGGAAASKNAPWSQVTDNVVMDARLFEALQPERGSACRLCQHRLGLSAPEPGNKRGRPGLERGPLLRISA